MLAQVTGAPSVRPPEVRLEGHDGKTQFRLGEVIRLDLVFPLPAGAPYSVNTIDYGDLADAVEITPKTGWVRWAGQSAHDYLSTGPLPGPEVRVSLVLNQGFVFHDPGHYEIHVTTNRLLSGGSNTKGFGPLTTDSLGIDILPMPSADEAALVRTLQAEITGTSPNQRDLHSPHREAIQNLAALGGDDALHAKLALILRADSDMRQVLGEAIASTRNLALQLTLLQQAWADPTQSPVYDLPWAMQETRALMRGGSLPGWTMIIAPPDPHDKTVQTIARDHAADMDALIRSLPARTGQSRTDALYILMEDRTLTPAQQRSVNPLALDDFPHMNTTQQRMLLETGDPSLHDALLVPSLRAMLDRDPTDKDAIKDLIRFDPEGAKPYVIRAICNRQSAVPLEAVAELPVQNLPEVDGCLSEMLRSPDTSYRWQMRAHLAGRFASAAVLPAVREGWTSPQRDGPVLAILLRYAPDEAVARLKTTDWHQFNTFFEINKVYDARKAAFPPQLTAWLREVVRTGPPEAAGRAAYELSRYRDPNDRVLLEERLAQLRAAWKGRGAEVASADWQSEAGKAKQLDMELMSDLRGPNLWTETDAEAADLARGCLSDQCRLYGQPRPVVPAVASVTP